MLSAQPVPAIRGQLTTTHNLAFQASLPTLIYDNPYQGYPLFDKRAFVYNACEDSRNHGYSYPHGDNYIDA